ncbi:MAG: DUF1015 domain-containing protein [Desulfobulbaceae bacterium]|nr:DUF1015 domain-containing protein [Desulfobulbaceae bacterium]
MAVVAPFRGVRYNPEKIEQIEEVLTPPYDVINEEEGASFLKKNPYSMIQLDLRNTGQKQAADTGRYSEAGARFDSWQEERILIRDQQPAIYLYFTEYLHPSGKKLTRKGLVSLVGLAEFSEGIVKPHEETFAGVISDRLELMSACGAQFSKVFSLYNDPRQEIMALLEQAREPEPVARAKDRDGNVHTLWRVLDSDTLAKVGAMFADKSLYIADGHHRYTTALACRKKALEKNPDLPPESPFNYIMMYLCACEDPGLSVLPTHRLLNYPEKITADQAAALAGADFSVREVTGGSREGLVKILLNRMDELALNGGLPALGLYHAGEDRGFLLQLTKEARDGDALAGRSPVLQQLDVVVLSDLLLHGVFGLSHEQCVREHLISYFSDPDTALDIAVKQSIGAKDTTPLLSLLNPTRVLQVTDVADRGEIMPHKSTYFYPKILTGLLINKLTGDSIVQGSE